MKLKKNSLFLICILVCLSGCASREVMYDDPIDLLSDDYWINPHILQIQVESVEDEKIPYSLRRGKTCFSAQNQITDIFEKRYPAAKNHKYTYKIYKTLYTEKNNCRLVVHIYMKNLKEILK